MGMAFIDLDAYIEKKENKSVSQIFEESGEEYFRQLERDAVKELAYKKSIILATGGGTLTFQQNVDTLKNANNKIILLDLPVEVISKRLQGDTKRPLLNRPDKEKVMRELYEKRLPLYRSAADIIVNAANSPMQVCMEIISNI